MTRSDAIWPTELRVTGGGGVLAVTFEDGMRFELTAEHLRVESPSAEVQGHSAAEKKIIGGKRHVRVLAATPVGNYAVRLRFDDGHDSGLFTWRYLHELGINQQAKWQAYLEALAAMHLER